MTQNEKVYQKILADINNYGRRVGNTTELINAHYKFKTHGQRPLNIARQTYIDNELKWYLSKDRNILNHEGIRSNTVWKKCAAENGNTNSNYGWCVYSKENCSQFEYAVQALIDDVNTRQSTCIYTRPYIQREWNDHVHASHDMICTFCTQHFIRADRLQYIVNMRSNDVRFGLPYDLEWHKYVYKDMFKKLRKHYPTLKRGYIHWNAGSLHKYD